MSKLAGALGFLLALTFGLSACISRSLTTPESPLTYGWVMAHSPDPGGHGWGVQIGPKTDGEGSHVAVYAWTDCTPSGCAWEFFDEYAPVVPGLVHDYSIVWSSDGWVLSADGRQVVTLNVGSPDGAVFESDANERTVA